MEGGAWRAWGRLWAKIWGKGLGPVGQSSPSFWSLPAQRVAAAFPGDVDRLRRMSLVEEGAVEAHQHGTPVHRRISCCQWRGSHPLRSSRRPCETRLRLRPLPAGPHPLPGTGHSEPSLLAPSTGSTAP